MKKLSIITICKNACEDLRDTGNSVRRNAVPWVEWVVIDGGSTDGTESVLESFQGDIDVVVSEPDDGIADAFNKGVNHSSGEYVLFLNAGDVLADGLLLDMRPHLFSDSVPPLVVGRISIDGQMHGRAVSFKQQIMRNHLPHQAMFINRSLFDRYGLYQPRYRLGMDYEWSLRIKSIWPDISFVPVVVSYMKPGGVSISNYKGTFMAYHAARCEHGYNRGLSLLLSYFYVAKMSLGRFIKRRG
ncbi:glycosyltransferase family 2 protein [Granulosicoccaceae sp. 1_MG-2023]|nr:glycosyltransferase family 2 protein [Granulosicoccaceae sp. 1_MG-2023]